jgi:hypothetical protein
VYLHTSPRGKSTKNILRKLGICSTVCGRNLHSCPSPSVHISIKSNEQLAGISFCISCSRLKRVSFKSLLEWIFKSGSICNLNELTNTGVNLFESLSHGDASPWSNRCCIPAISPCLQNLKIAAPSGTARWVLILRPRSHEDIAIENTIEHPESMPQLCSHREGWKSRHVWISGCADQVPSSSNGTWQDATVVRYNLPSGLRVEELRRSLSWDFFLDFPEDIGVSVDLRKFGWLAEAQSKSSRLLGRSPVSSFDKADWISLSRACRKTGFEIASVAHLTFSRTAIKWSLTSNPIVFVVSRTTKSLSNLSSMDVKLLWLVSCWLTKPWLHVTKLRS